MKRTKLQFYISKDIFKMAKKRLPVAESSAVMPTKVDKDRERRWRAEDALRTCKEYEKIKNDKVLMSDVKRLAKEEMNKLKKVAG